MTLNVVSRTSLSQEGNNLKGTKFFYKNSISLPCLNTHSTKYCVDAGFLAEHKFAFD